MKFTEVNPETSKIWSRPEMFAALMEARTDRDEALAALAAFAAATSQSSRLTSQDVWDRWVLPAGREDLKERPQFWADAKCGYQTVSKWIREGIADLRKPLFKVN